MVPGDAPSRTLPGTAPSSVHNMGMQLPFVVVLFLILAVVLAVVILAAVAMPHLRLPREDGDGTAAEHPRHTSRTGRG